MIKRIILLGLCCCPIFVLAQEENLLSSIEDSLPVTEKVTGAFRSTRVINAHSVEMLGKRNLDFRIMHRFGFVSDGLKQFFGLDAASMRMSFDYGISDCLMVGVGRSTFRKELDGFAKVRLIQQARGARPIPLSVLLAAGYIIHTDESFAVEKPNFVERSAFYFQLITGRKFSDKFSLQFSPMFLHINRPVVPTDDQDLFAFGVGARYGISRRVAITFDYHHPIGTLDDRFTDPLSIGVDISTGGHTFQLQFSNAIGMNERAYITQTTGEFFKGDIRFGFNLSRIFQVGHKKRKGMDANDQTSHQQ